MITANPQILKSKYAGAVIVAALTILSWHPVLSVNFLNDDFQILGYHKPATFVECFKPFCSPDVSSVYYRPVVNTMHSLMVYTFGFHPLPFRISGLIVISVVSVLFYLFCRQHGISAQTSLIVAVLFSVAPAHEMAVGWIAGIGDPIVAVFLLAYFMFYTDWQRSDRFASGVLCFAFLFTAMLCKEIAFMGLLFPLIALMENPLSGKRKIFGTLSIGIALVALIFLIRDGVGAASLAHSPAASNFSVLSALKNTLLYIPASFFSVDIFAGIISVMRERSVSLIQILQLIIAVSTFVIVIYAARGFRKQFRGIKRKTFYSLALYLMLVAPVSSLFMRWYAFLPSIGCFLFAAQVFDGDKKESKMRTAIVLLLITVSISLNIVQMQKWTRVSQSTQSIFSSLEKLESAGSKALYFWAVPAKIDGVNSMKIGFQQAVHFFSRTDSADVRVLLQAHITGESDVNVTISNDSTFVIKSVNTTFQFPGESTELLPSRNASRLRGIDYDIEVTNAATRGAVSTATCTIHHSCNALNIIFDGTAFRKLILNRGQRKQMSGENTLTP